MAWEDIQKISDDNKPTAKQIAYAEILLEALYGDINKPIYKMSKRDLSLLIDETKKTLEYLNIDYHSDYKHTRR